MTHFVPSSTVSLKKKLLIFHTTTHTQAHTLTHTSWEKHVVQSSTQMGYLYSSEREGRGEICLHASRDKMIWD